MYQQIKESNTSKMLQQNISQSPVILIPDIIWPKTHKVDWRSTRTTVNVTIFILAPRQSNEQANSYKMVHTAFYTHCGCTYNITTLTLSNYSLAVTYYIIIHNIIQYNISTYYTIPLFKWCARVLCRNNSKQLIWRSTSRNESYDTLLDYFILLDY